MSAVPLLQTVHECKQPCGESVASDSLPLTLLLTAWWRRIITDDNSRYILGAVPAMPTSSACSTGWCPWPTVTTTSSRQGVRQPGTERTRQGATCRPASQTPTPRCPAPPTNKRLLKFVNAELSEAEQMDQGPGPWLHQCLARLYMAWTDTARRGMKRGLSYRTRPHLDLDFGQALVPPAGRRPEAAAHGRARQLRL